MTKEAKVIKLLPDGMAEVVVKRESACGGNCHACGATCASKRMLTVSARNTVAASMGDDVMISSRTSGILQAAVIVYIIPIILFFAGYIAAAAAGASETVSVAASVGGFFAGVVIAVVLNRWYRERQVTTFEIVRILNV